MTNDDASASNTARAAPENVRAWMDGYIRAWKSNDAEEVAALFTEDATYLTAPFREPRIGRQEIVDGWLSDRDQPDGWTFEWSPLVASGDLATVIGETRYSSGRTYSNLWVIRFAADGRASEYTEWFMDQPTAVVEDS